MRKMPLEFKPTQSKQVFLSVLLGYEYVRVDCQQELLTMVTVYYDFVHYCQTDYPNNVCQETK